MLFVHHPAISVGSPWLDEIGLQQPERFAEIVRDAPQVKLIVDGRTAFPDSLEGLARKSKFGPRTKLEVLGANGEWQRVPKQVAALAPPKEGPRPYAIDLTEAFARADAFESGTYRVRLTFLFKTYVDTVEIETHSFCNRVCSFCPNAVIDRRSRNDLLSDIALEKICDNLREISFSGHIIFSGYNEPFFGDSILKWAEGLKGAAPDCRLLVISNGDYLTRDVLYRAAEDLGTVLHSGGCDHVPERGILLGLAHEIGGHVVGGRSRAESVFLHLPRNIPFPVITLIGS